MSKEPWRKVSKSDLCPVCGKPDWCAWTPDGEMLKCERNTDAPVGMVLVKAADGGGLFKYGDSQPSRPPKAQPARAKTARAIYGTAEEAFAVAGRRAKDQLMEAWSYPGDTFRIARYRLPNGGKTYRPIHRNGDGWSIGDPAGALPLYHGDTIGDAGPVVVVEGEKCADAAASVGLAAVTSAHGGGSFHKSDWSPLAGREVIILPDNDDIGRKYAKEVAGILAALMPPAKVKIVELPGLGDGGDIADWIDADGPMGGRDVETIKAAILDMAKTAQTFLPKEPATSAPSVKPIEPYRPFPVEWLPEPMRSFVAQAAEAIGCDAAFVAMPLLAAVASAIGNTRRIELKRGWTEPSILWTVIVGDSGTLKSPALELALRHLRQRQRDAMKQYAQDEETHKVQALRYDIDLTAWKKSGGEGPPPVEPTLPSLARCWCDDTTIEALAVLLVQNWRGLLMVRDELAGWLGGFDRYAQGKGGDVAKWLEMHGGRPITVDRKTGNPKLIYVPCAAISVTGGIQPSALQRALGREYYDNGLAARLLLACPPARMKQWTESEVDATTEQAIATVLDCLYSLKPVVGQDGEPEPGIVRLAPAAKSAWIRFYNEHAQEHVGLTGDLSAAWSKLEGYAARLALVVHLVRWAASDLSLGDPDMVDEESIAAGAALSRWFGRETRRVYAILNETDTDRQSRWLADLVRRHGGSLTTRDLMRCSRSHQTSEIAEQALNGLVQAGLGQWEDAGPTAQGGRPTRRFILVSRVDVDETQRILEKADVSSTRTKQAAIPPVSASGGSVPTFVDRTRELPKKSAVVSTSTLPTPAILQTTPDPDHPGPLDLLVPHERAVYDAAYSAAPAEMSPAEKHAGAWKAAMQPA